MDKKFNEIEISNFRGFDSIKIDRLSGLNVFVGANNVGKSTILEAVFMLVGMANPIMPMRVNYSRTQTNSDMDSLKYLFHNIDFNNQPLLKAKTGTSVRRLTFSPFFRNTTEASSSDISLKSTVKQLNFDFDVQEKDGFSYHTALFVGVDGTLQQTLDATYKEDLNCLFLWTKMTITHPVILRHW